MAPDQSDRAPLISIERLAGLLGAAAGARGPAAATLLDVRWSLSGPPGRELYAVGHIPGARFVDLDHQLAGRPGPNGEGGRHPLPSADDFQAVMRSLGVSDDRPVVVYDAADSTSAARAWWLLRYFSHADVRVLDGGYAAWATAGLPIATGDAPGGPEPGAATATGNFIAVPGAMPVADADAAAKLAVEGILLDARAAARFRGEVEPIDPVAGHIPGALSAPTRDNVGPDDRFLPTEILRTRFASLGANCVNGREVGVYCGSGVTAAHQVLALELAGIKALLYPGSWSDWVTDPARPVATGE
ncbi:sulfurtransferase [Actinocrinis puniceicyclus]|uniref:Sulfurtransferase n=1 Tax=Actinocrinis puniceicyclus TaxID=977794 RepID=A0A8J7WK97_9ACTN|nr:sulfurtransferase [Actinocrinis puniceicyclus]MBS2962420.1 sulfurtransferase [Actinocrinis puniceicyclus]